MGGVGSGMHVDGRDRGRLMLLGGQPQIVTLSLSFINFFLHFASNHLFMLSYVISFLYTSSWEGNRFSASIHFEGTI